MATLRFRPPIPDYPSAIPMSELSRIVTQDAGASICIVGADLRFQYVNEPFAKALGFAPGQMVRMTILDAYGPAHIEVLTAYLQRALAGESLNYERFGRMAQKDGLWRTVALRPWRDADGQIAGVIGVAMTVQELKIAAEKLRVANERLSSHMDNSPLLVIDLDASLNITHCSIRSQQVFGQLPDDLVGCNVLAQLGGLHADSLRVSFERLQRGEESRNHVASTHVRADGTLLHCEWFNSALTDANGQVTSIMSLVEDVSARVTAEAQLRRMAMHDQLTGLHNRASLEECVAAALALGERNGATVTLIFVDLDGFKSINDAHGHAAGDRVLSEVATRIKGCVRAADTVARLGGDEFVVLLHPDGNTSEPDAVVDRLFLALQLPVDVGDSTTTVGASIGIAQHAAGPGTASDLLRRADAAMYEAKRAGKGQARRAA
ncbi:diguanylate cyclase [Casimicrobium huifangae]|uniref:diguanylate cyclase n=1 Tax=Casimicrobium huifangae TaxID=2591109 RepID=UPI0012EBF8A9|nr:diguanylate cyclase [Casimicrobium huifangae]